jgi:hypothetical protein
MQMLFHYSYMVKVKEWLGHDVEPNSWRPMHNFKAWRGEMIHKQGQSRKAVLSWEMQERNVQNLSEQHMYRQYDCLQNQRRGCGMEHCKGAKALTFEYSYAASRE